MAIKGTITVHSDFMEKLTQASPMNGLAELIWNGFDADAKEVKIFIEHNELDGISAVYVRDDGVGIPHDKAEGLFSGLGGSWKKLDRVSKKQKRQLHGQEGRGRFKAFALGDTCEWSTQHVRSDGKVESYSILITQNNLRNFQGSELEILESGTSGTEVKIENLHANFGALERESALESLKGLFALYLVKYPGTSITYQGKKIDNTSLDIAITNLKLETVTVDGKEYDVTLDIAEWGDKTVKRGLYLCDGNGFTFHEEQANVYAPGFSFTAYLKSELFRVLYEGNELGLQGFKPEVQALLESAKAELKSHFRKRLSERGADIISEWKAQNVYPYEGEPKNPIEKAEREIFDVVALNVNEYLSDFEKNNVENKKFSLSLLKQALSDNPTTLKKILVQLLNLPKKKQDEFAKLLEKTSLSAIINASKMITDRLDFLKGLEALVYDYEKNLLERSQLHRLIAHNAWIFGEEFHLTTDDESLTSVLRNHRQQLGEKGKGVVIGDESVKVPRKATGIVDLVLSQFIDRGITDRREHLVIELKRPSQKINTKVIGQTEDYALAVIKDKRFFNIHTKWTFYAISNEWDEYAKPKARQPDRPRGCIQVYEEDKHTASLWIKTWSEVIEECRNRLEFYRRHLEYQATKDVGLQYLQATHEQYIPSEAIKAAKKKSAA